MTKKRQSTQIVTTETQLLAILDKVKGGDCTSHDQSVKDIKETITELGRQIKTLDESIRGNGKPGLNTKVANVEKDLEDLEREVTAAKKSAKENTLATRWKIGIVMFIIISLISSIPSFHTMFAGRTASTHEATRTIILEVLQEVIQTKKPTKDTHESPILYNID